MADKMLNDILEKLAKTKYKNENPDLVFDPDRPVETVSCGSAVVDSITGVGGLLCKRKLVELIGVESSGKTTLCMQTCREALKKGWRGVFIDYEGTYDNSYSEALGLKVDGDRFTVIQPITAEEGETCIDTLLADLPGKIDFFMIDSIASCRPKAFMEKSPDDPARVGLHAAYCALFIDKLNKLALRHHLAFLFTNQLRSKIPTNDMKYSLLNTGIGAGFDFKNTTATTTGGTTIRHLMAARYILMQSSAIREDGDIEGQEVDVANWCQIKNVKNKLAVPKKKTRFVIRFGTGTDDVDPIFQILKDTKKIVNAGAWFNFNIDGFTTERFQGRKGIIKYMSQPDVLQKLLPIALGSSYELPDLGVTFEDEGSSESDVLKI